MVTKQIEHPVSRFLRSEVAPHRLNRLCCMLASFIHILRFIRVSIFQYSFSSSCSLWVLLCSEHCGIFRGDTHRAITSLWRSARSRSDPHFIKVRWKEKKEGKKKKKERKEYSTIPQNFCTVAAAASPFPSSLVPLDCPTSDTVAIRNIITAALSLSPSRVFRSSDLGGRSSRLSGIFRVIKVPAQTIGTSTEHPCTVRYRYSASP